PVLLAAKVRPEGGELVVRGRTASGPWEARAQLAPASGDTTSPRGDEPPAAGSVAALFAREAVEDHETRLAAGADAAAIDAAVKRLGLDYQIATRLTSWVAIDRTPSVDPLQPTRHEVVPQALPHGMSVAGLGLRAPTSMRFISAARAAAPTMMSPAALGGPVGAARTRATAMPRPPAPPAPAKMRSSENEGASAGAPPSE